MPTIYNPPVSTYVALQTTTLGSSTAAVTFSSIPNTYRDLVLVGTFAAGTNGTFSIRVNGDGGNNYSRVYMVGSGSGSGVFGATTNNAYRLLSYSSTISLAIAHLIDYSASDRQKTLLFRGNDGSNEVNLMAGRWTGTAAVNQMYVFSDGGAFGAGSTFSLYGIEA